ncbi:heparinase II/III family protein [Ruficoccus sp. ZRK36]|uniref:heparinase II/III domain-containing protein n=1 Tax=Ruficoccus sp. ZRK36 TaxID=2866311 RepID=UPI001C72E970|nr:heparinase II/III family protein [Ruficoccus sp. ZRK36]QYY37408.1 heparinase II/III-family protein [Ruficoccus sp. ZRK36]
MKTPISYMCLTVVSLLITAACSRPSVEVPASSEGAASSVAIDNASADVSSQVPLLLSGERLSHIREQARQDPLLEEVLEMLRSVGEANLEEPPIGPLEKSPELQQCRRASSRLLTNAFLYRLDGDERYLYRTRENLLQVCDWPDWNPRKFLCEGETAFAVAVTYSWIADKLSEEDAATIKAALYDNLLRDAPQYYSRTPIKGLNWHAFGESAKTINNWNFICNAGFLAAAIVLQSDYPELSGQVITDVGESLPLAMVNYAPDGIWPEGPVYWHYGTGYLVNTLELLHQQGGQAAVVEEKLVQMSGFANTLDYILNAFGPSGVAFNYADCKPVPEYRGNIFNHLWLAKRFQRSDTLPLLRDIVKKRLDASTGMDWSRDGRPLLFSALYFPSEQKQGAETQLPLDIFMDGNTELVVMRSDDGPEPMWAALKGGFNGLPHGHLDLGSFVLESQGVRWAQDLGPEAYLPGYWQDQNGGSRWEFYRTNNRSHSTLTLGDALQDANAQAEVVEFSSMPDEVSATIDLSAVYPGQVDSLTRTLTMWRSASDDDNSPPELLVEDTFEGLRGGTEVTWRMMTQAQARIAEDGRSVVLEQAGKSLRLEIVEGDASAQFSLRPAIPPTMLEDPNEGYSELLIKWTPTEDNEVLGVSIR